MTRTDKRQELSLYFLKLQTYNDITTYDYLQNIVINLSAKTIIEERKRKFQNAKSIEEMLQSSLQTLSYEETIDEYLEAAKQLMPAFYNQFSLSDIYEGVLELSTSDYGLETCYEFLKLKEFDSSRKILYNFKSSKQTNYIYDDNQNETSESLLIEKEFSFFEDGVKYELEMLDLKTRSIQRIGNFQFDIEAHGFVMYKNSDYQLKFNRDNFFFVNSITALDIIDINQKWVIAYE